MKAGPYLAAALFCDRLLEEKNGVLSAIRIADTYTVKTTGLPPNTIPSVATTLLLSFRAGEARGIFHVNVAGRFPSGRELQPRSMAGEQSPPAFTITFNDGANPTANLILNLSIPAIEFGWYSFDVLMEGEIVARASVRVLPAPPGNP
ncbi:MAG: DUF6941 family protein [Candidatus Binataceae bacterium]